MVTGICMQIKTIGANGQVTLGTKYAGQSVIVVDSPFVAKGVVDLHWEKYGQAAKIFFQAGFLW